MFSISNCSGASRIPSIFYKGQNIPLDGTEDNFRKAAQKIGQSVILPDSYDSDEDVSARQGGVKDFFIWREGMDPPKAWTTTVTCQDGNIKGNVLLQRCRLRVGQLLNYLKDGFALEYELPGLYFATHAGAFAKIKTGLDCQKEFQPGTYEFGLSSVKTRLSDDERLFIEDEELKSWITNDLGLAVTRWDLPYRSYKGVIGIDQILEAIKKKVVSYTAPKPRPVPDNELGTAQLYAAFPLSHPIGDGPYVKLLQQGALHKFLDYFNALIFGVEASRNNLVFFTGLVSLILMRYGSYPSGDSQEGTYFYSDLLDLFPMCATNTGKGNFVLEKAMYVATNHLEENRERLDGKRELGFSIFRANPGWLKVGLKSAILIRNWLGNEDFFSAAEYPVRRLEPYEKMEDSDDLDTRFEKQSRNLQNSLNFFDRLDEELWMTLSYYYFRSREGGESESLEDSEGKCSTPPSDAR